MPPTPDDEFDLDVRLFFVQQGGHGCINDPPHTTTCQAPTCQVSTCWDNCVQPQDTGTKPQVLSNQCHLG